MPFLPDKLAVPLGGLLLALSAAIVLLAARELAQANTAFDVRRPTTTVVSSGVFRFSRNPVYLSMTLLQLSIACLANSLWVAILVVPLGSLLCFAAIKPEERYLEQKFGPSYQQYRRSVRRWI